MFLKVWAPLAVGTSWERENVSLHCSDGVGALSSTCLSNLFHNALRLNGAEKPGSQHVIRHEKWHTDWSQHIFLTCLFCVSHGEFKQILRRKVYVRHRFVQGSTQIKSKHASRSDNVSKGWRFFLCCLAEDMSISICPNSIFFRAAEVTF